MIKLTGNLTINVPLPGDTGNGSIANRYSIQPAIDMLKDYDFNGYDVTIQLASAPVNAYNFYKPFKLSGRFVNQAGLDIPLLNKPGFPPFQIGKRGRLTIRGNTAWPLGAFIYPDVGEGAAVSISECASLNMEGVAMDSSRSNQDCIDVFHSSFLNLAYIRFGNAGPVNDLFANHISAGFNSTVWISGPIAVSGSGSSFCNVGSSSSIYWNNNADPAYPLSFSFIGVPNLPRGFILADFSIAYPMAISWSGSFNGPQSMVVRNGVVFTNGAGCPGSAPPIIQSGGQYL